MNLFLRITISADQFTFLPSVTVENAQYIDIDNFSDSVMVETVGKAIDLTERLFVFLKIEGEYDHGLLMKLLNRIVKTKVPKRVLYQGKHQKIDKLLRLMNAQSNDAECVINEAKIFFNT